MESNQSKRSPLLVLPKELRDAIYQFSFSNSDEAPKRPVEPPITQVSKLIRAESLTTFYKNFTLKLQVIIKCDSRGHVWLTTNKWYRQLGVPKLQQIRTYLVRFSFLERYFGEPVTIMFTIELDKRTASYSIRHEFGDAWVTDVSRKGDPADCAEVVSILQRHLVKTLDALLLDPGVGAFTARHLDRLAAVIPEALPKG